MIYYFLLFPFVIMSAFFSFVFLCYGVKENKFLLCIISFLLMTFSGTYAFYCLIAGIYFGLIG